MLCNVNKQALSSVTAWEGKTGSEATCQQWLIVLPSNVVHVGNES